MKNDPPLAVFLCGLFVFALAVGAYLGINRTTDPFNAPTSQDKIDRRLAFKKQHIVRVKAALIVTGVLLALATVYLIVTHA